MKLTVGVTGHRDLVKDEMPALRDQVRAFLIELDADYPDLDLQILSPLAEGADQLVAEVALELDLPVIVPLPMRRDEYEKDFTDDGALERFQQMLAQCEIISLPIADEDAGGTGVLLATDRERQYAQMGIFISNHCQILLALWDGKIGGAIGGTAGVVNYHLTAVMPGYSVAEESPNLLADNENDLAYHIAVSRNRPDGGPVQGLDALDACWMSAHFERGDTKKMPAEYATMLQRLQEFNADFNKYETQIKDEQGSLLEDAPDQPLPGGAGLVNSLFGRTDWLAVHFQKRFNYGMIVTHVLAVVMGIVFIIYTEYNGPEFLLYLFLAMFGVGVLFYILGERRQWHRKYLDYRALAEGLRVQLYWSLAGVVKTQSAVFAYDNFLQKQDVDLGWIRHVMRSASLRRDRRVSPHDAWVDWVVKQWVGHGDSKSGQLAYYQSKSGIKAANYRRTTLMGSLALWAGILIAVALAFVSDAISMDQRHLLLVLMGVLPLIAGVRDAFSHKKAERELIKQYRFMGKVFANAQRLLDSSNDLQFQRRVLMAVGNAALEEHAEWILMHRERPLEHGGL